MVGTLSCCRQPVQKSTEVVYESLDDQRVVGREGGHRVILRRTPSSGEGEITTMTANSHSIDLSALVAEHLERAEPDLLRSMLRSFIQALMSAEADAVCGAA
jgi:hypothetical protein